MEGSFKTNPEIAKVLEGLALKEGNAEQTFKVADGVDPKEAVNKSQLDQKASLEGADFVDMPMVNGVEIIEFDSNSNGYWARCAGGLMINFRVVTNVNFGLSGDERVDYPQNFINEICSGSWDIKIGTTEIASAAQTYLRCTDTQWRLYKSGNWDFTRDVGFVSIGIWEQP
ncbi:MAG: hypothetical protein WEA58_03985 [Balneolaceae bacterium]